VLCGIKIKFQTDKKHAFIGLWQLRDLLSFTVQFAKTRDVGVVYTPSEEFVQEHNAIANEAGDMLRELREQYPAMCAELEEGDM
jgi:hypothetical protein